MGKANIKENGFSILELVVVVIIVGVLAVTGFPKYAATVERMRGAEARGILGLLRKRAISHRMEYGTINTFTPAYAGIGTGNDQIPGNAASSCRRSHYFWYDVVVSDPAVTMIATRCTGSGCSGGSGKAPSAPIAFTLILRSNLASGQDVWDPGGLGDPLGY
jgi:prepilin-type N-terminal cleavage/methylation domain-containing protein